MRKKISTGIFAIALLITASWGVQMNMSNNSNLSDLSLANIEALAQLEDGCDICHLDNYGREAKTERCQLDLGGGMFTTSVKRVCKYIADASSTCFPVDCGVVF